MRDSHPRALLKASFNKQQLLHAGDHLSTTTGPTGCFSHPKVVVYLVRGIAVHQCLGHNTARKYPRLYNAPIRNTIELHRERGISPRPVSSPYTAPILIPIPHACNLR